MRRQAIDLVVGGHECNRTGFAQSFLEGVQEGLSQHAHGDIRRSAIHARFRLPVTNEVLESGQHMLLAAERCVSLETPHRRDP